MASNKRWRFLFVHLYRDLSRMHACMHVEGCCSTPLPKFRLELRLIIMAAESLKYAVAARIALVRLAATHHGGELFARKNGIQTYCYIGSRISGGVPVDIIVVPSGNSVLRNLRRYMHAYQVPGCIYNIHRYPLLQSVR